MKTAVRHILCVIYALLSVLCAKGQTLNRYELLCKECLELKDKVNSGITVSRAEASELIERFVMMNAEIKTESKSMSDADRIRFEAINRWFSTGIRPLVLDHRPLVENTPFSVRFLDVPYDRSVVGYNKDQAVSTRHADVHKNHKTYILTGVSVPNTSYGALIGYQFKKWGGYVRFSSNFRSSTPKYSCFSDGTIKDQNQFWPSGNSFRSYMTASAGLLYGPVEWLSIYGGLGYGRSHLDWEDIDGYHARVEDLSFKGLMPEAGILTSWKFIALGLGVSTITFHTFSFDISLGISF